MARRINFAILLLVSFNVSAKPVDDLVEIMGGNDMINKLHHQMLSVLTTSNPSLEANRPIVEQWFKTYFTWEETKPQMVAMYEKHFTDQEISELLDFYSSPVGKKSIEIMPVLFGEGAQIGQNLAMKYVPQLEEMLGNAK